MSTARALREQSITEKQFQAWVGEIARALHWQSFHVFDSRRSQPGFPDLVLVKESRLIFAELKRKGGKTTPAQDWWLDALSVVAQANQTIEVYLWRPSDAEEIEAVLKRAA